MLRKFSILACSAALWLCGSSAQAGLVLASGNSFDNSNPTFTTNLAKLSGDTFVFTPPSLLDAPDLVGVDALWLDGFSDYPNLAVVAPYLMAGGTVLVQNAGFGSQPLSAYPGTAGLSAVFVSGDSVHVLNPSNPINAGLTDANLSGWGMSYFGFYLGLPSPFIDLSDDGNTGEFITLVRPFGLGTIVYTHQGISQSLSAVDLPLSSGQLTLLGNVLSITSAPEPASILLAGVGLAGMGFGMIRRKTRSS